MWRPAGRYLEDVLAIRARIGGVGWRPHQLAQLCTAPPSLVVNMQATCLPHAPRSSAPSGKLIGVSACPSRVETGEEAVKAKGSGDAEGDGLARPTRFTRRLSMHCSRRQDSPLPTSTLRVNWPLQWAACMPSDRRCYREVSTETVPTDCTRRRCSDASPVPYCPATLARLRPATFKPIRPYGDTKANIVVGSASSPCSFRTRLAPLPPLGKIAPQRPTSLRAAWYLYIRCPRGKRKQDEHPVACAVTLASQNGL